MSFAHLIYSQQLLILKWTILILCAVLCCAVRLTLRRKVQCDPDTHGATPPPNLNQHNSLPLKPKWLGNQYEQNLIEGEVSGIMRELDRQSSDTSPGQTEVNKVVSDIIYMFNDAAHSLGMVRCDHTLGAVDCRTV